jgi:hypothetical protein
MKVIMVRPKYDDVTRTLNGWAGSAIGDISISDDLNGGAAVEAKLRTSLEKNRETELVSFYGHGSSTYLISHSLLARVAKPLINANSPGVLPKELAGRNVYAVACHAGAVLGPALSAARCHFVGYNMQFAYAVGFEEDFGGVVNRGLISWATDGKTAAQVADQLKEEWSALRRELSIGSRKTVANAFLAALSVNWNLAGVCSY